MKHISTRTVVGGILAALLIAGLALGAVPVPALAMLSSADVQVVPNVARTNARYTITFATGEGLAAGESVVLRFPLGTTLPCSPCNPLVLADEVTVNDLHPTQPAYGNPTAGTLKVFVPEAIPAGGTVAIVVCAKTPRIGNPDVGTYTIMVSTEHETGVPSNPYVIGTSQILSPSVHLESDIAGAGSGYTVTFVTGVTGQLVQGRSTMTITYAAGEFPSAYVPGSVLVNSVAPDKVTINQLRHTVEILLPVTVEPRAAVTVEFRAAFGLKNPATAGNYVVYVHTSSEPGDVVSQPFRINDLPTVATTMYVGPGSPDGQNGWYVSEPMVTLSPASNVPGRIEVWYGIDTEPATLYMNPFQVPAGTHVVRYAARNVDAGIDEQPVKEATFRVAVAGPVLAVDGPPEQLVRSGAFTLTGTVTATSAPVVGVDVLGLSTHVMPGGRFSEPLTLFEGVNELIVTATDESGRTTSATVSVTVDTTPPRLTVTSPGNWQEVRSEKIMVRGTVELGASLSVNGKTLPNLMPDGSFATEVALAVGANTITAEAQDAAGNMRRVAVVVTRMPANETTMTLTIGNRYMTVNGVRKEIDPGRGTVPVIENSRTLVPITAIIEALGGTTTWDATARSVTIVVGTSELRLVIGNATAVVNGVSMPIDAVDANVVPVIRNSRTMLPFRFVAEQLGGTVEWNAATRSVVLHFSV